MIPATNPDMLDRKVRDLVVLQDLQGFLLSGGSNRRNEIKYERYYGVLERLKRDFPHLKIAIHSALIDEARARAMASAGIDTAMLDIIGAEETIREVYHLDRPVEDFEASLAALTATRMEVVPHIVIGLHYGRILGESRALDIVARTPSIRWCWSSSCRSMRRPARSPRQRPKTSAACSWRRAVASPSARFCLAAPGRRACTSESPMPMR